MNQLTNQGAEPTELRHDWTQEEVMRLWNQPFNDLIFQAHSLHRQLWPANAVQKSTLLSIKTGGCPEDCKYCPQSARYSTGLEVEKLMAVQNVVDEARLAKAAGATRYCMGAAWRNPRGKQFEQVLEMVRQVKDLGLETCATLGMLEPEQAVALKQAGLDYYNHNIDTDPEFYGDIITTRTFSDRLQTLAAVREAGVNVCCGGIVGMGEGREHRAGMLRTLANLPEHPESVPINLLVQVEGTPLSGLEELDGLEFVRTVAVARLIMPKSYVRLSAGRESMSDELQALCYFAGANSVFFGPKLLTTANPEADKDAILFERLGIGALHPDDVAR
jgi:biotin synthase